nr:8423_t:CDS:2 [Entrophospora candida]
MNSYRKKLIESLIINYWNQKMISKNTGFYNCLQQIGTKINLTSDDKWEVHRLYYSTLSTLSEESSISQAVRKKMEAEKKDFMEEDTNEIAEEKDETTDEYACIENEVFDVENNKGDDDSTTHNQALVPNEDIQFVERDDLDAIYQT